MVRGIHDQGLYEEGKGENIGGEDILMEGGGEIYKVRRLYGTGST